MTPFNFALCFIPVLMLAGGLLVRDYRNRQNKRQHEQELSAEEAVSA